MPQDLQENLMDSSGETPAEEQEIRQFQALQELKAKRDRTIKEIEESFHKANEGDFEDEEKKELLINPPKRPGFPFLIVGVAALKDLLDTLDVTGIGVFFTTVLSLILALIMGLWSFGKMSGGWWKKRLIRWLLIRYLLVVIIEFIPGIKIIPTNTIFIIMAHNKEKKIVQLFNLALEKLKKAGF